MNEYLTLICEAPAKFAKQPAIVDHDGTRVTDYETFGDLMFRTASWVNEKHFNSRKFIPVRFEASMEFAACVCGVWLAGHVAVPMGKSFPDERVKYICMNCEAPLVIDDSVIDEIKQTEILDLSAFPGSEEEDEAFLLYTSGSTGMPKGIIHKFSTLLDNQKMGTSTMYGAGMPWALGAPFYFVASVVVYKIITYGGCVHLMDETTMRDVRKLEDYYEKHQIAIGFISPSVLTNFHNRTESLKVVMTGSEKLTGQCGKDGYRLINNYGMSETLGTITHFQVDKPYEQTPVGKPDENLEWALLDDDMNPVPDGEEGELCVKGNFTPGYFKNPEATKKLYRGGWLHTGDILKMLPDGNLVYVNRKDWMVKINGQRVEPGEIENVIRAVDGVENAVVKAIEGKDGKIFLSAYYTGEQMEDSELVEKISEKLPPYMIPAFFMYMDKLPINMNGKIDRKSLPEPDGMSKRSEYVPPEN
ncbi:MAG: AMP-binding protein, partial [Lachnospiraceae bacterium]|nr:AMP-binding protein [Lachnospiraceae bacterium]